MISNLKIFLAQINTSVGDLEGNAQKILECCTLADQDKCDLIIFPEMTICGYPCEDLWQKSYFIEACQEKISEICKATKNLSCALIIGSPTIDNERKKKVLRNSALFIDKGEIKKIIHKKSLPNYGVFDEKRYFTQGQHLSSVDFRGQNLSILICEDLWDNKNLFLLSEQSTDLVIAINASPYSCGKHSERIKTAKNFTKNLNKPLIYLNQVGSQDSLVFDGSSFVLDRNGETILQMSNFEEDSKKILVEKSGSIMVLQSKNESHQNTQSNFSESKIEQNYCASVLALRDYLRKNNFQKVLLGMSGGIDSAVVAMIANDALSIFKKEANSKENLVELYALTTRFNSENSVIDAKTCATNLSLELKNISIQSAFELMLSTVSSSNQKINSLAKENLQSRIRGNILMTISNSTNALLLSTGNKSELACGYATIYGDMCGAFNPIKDFYKTEIYELARWRNNNFCKISYFQKLDLIPQTILNKAPTAELRENQKDSDSLPEYEILDQILFSLIEEQKSLKEIIADGFDEKIVNKVSNLFYNSEYKRKQAVLGPKISNISFDKDRRYPISNKFKI